jgi:iron complex outermembrane recepter protein
LQTATRVGMTGELIAALLPQGGRHFSVVSTVPLGVINLKATKPAWRRRLTAAALSLGVAAASDAIGVAWADNSPAAQPVLELKEIVVTAERRAQSINDAPVALSALSGAQLASSGAQDITDVARQIPSLDVQFGNGPGTVAYRLRRVGNFGNIPAFEPEVGLFEDGAFRSRSFFGSGELLDLDRVEVLNGPQSTLYGKNATSGVIAMYSRAPAATPEVTVEGDLGEMDAERDALLGTVKASASGPIAGALRGSLSAGYTAHGSLFSSDLANGPTQNDLSRYATRGQLSITHGQAKWRLIVEALGSNGRTGSPDSETIVPGSSAAAVQGFLASHSLASACSGAGIDSYGSCLYAPYESNLAAQDATLLGSYRLADGVTLDSVTSWDNYSYQLREADAVQLGAPIVGYYDQQHGHSIQQELRLTSPGGQKVDWLGGAFFYHNMLLRGSPSTPTFYAEELAAQPFWKPLLQQLVGAPVVMAAPGQESFVDSPLTTDYVAAFGQTTWNLTGRAHLNAGLRWQNEQKHAVIDQFQNDATPSLMTLAINTSVPPTALDRSTSKVTWQLTPQFDLTANTMLYATAAEGFKSGGYNTGYGDLPASEREFGDETVRNYELGLKSVIRHRMQIHGALFDTVYHDFQDAAFVGGQFTVTNAPKVTDKGGELGIDAVFTDSLAGGLSVSYADLRYTVFTDGACWAGRTPDGSVPGTCNLSGQRLIDAPPTKVSANLRYHVPVRLGRLFARIDADWSTRYNTSFSGDPRLTQAPYTWLRARLGLDHGDTEIALWGDNLLNERVIMTDVPLNLFSRDPSTQGILEAPRSFGIMLRESF